MVLGVFTGFLRRAGSHTPLGNFTSKRGNKNFYKGRGGKKYGIPGPRGVHCTHAFEARPYFVLPPLHTPNI